MGLGTTAFTLSVEMHALKDVSAPLAALIYTAEPLWGALFAWVLLGERWGPSGWLGAALIVGSCLAAQLAGSGKDEVADAGAPLVGGKGKAKAE
jgi:drug/metabolite transporter (DMT)-like permease